MLASLIYLWADFARARQSLGFLPALLFSYHQLRWRFSLVRRSFTLVSKEALCALTCRPASSDLDVFRHVFVDREYACLDDLTGVRLVIDCGANVGYSTAYFLSRFPSCKAIAVEPSPGNYAMLKQNLAPYEGRVCAMQAAVWAHPADLVFSETRYRSGRECTRQVRECRPGEKPDVVAVDIGTLLAESGMERVSILKIDVEGAEAIIFTANYEAWIDRIDNIVIELHDDSYFGEASKVFYRAISGRPFDVSRFGELVVCKRHSDWSSVAR